ncbi:MAG: tol-pal system protein YbgF [Deltaproteobacteria bacterium RIFCSPLOWO2_02_FULL_53_8]|nr:MAG: tol-pal system protein YbgF [Deltaproteobacteria bacterium RIFCSPLOWO2_02_FULL_53_8]
MKNRRLLTLCSIIIALGAGCAMMEERADTLRDINGRMTDLDAQLRTSNSRIEELDNKFHILQEKLQTMQSSRPDAGQSSAQSAQPGIEPPEGLAVITLSGGEGKQPSATPAQPEKAAKKAKHDNTVVVSKGQDSEASPELTGDNEGPDALYSRGQDLFMAGRYDESREVFSRLASAYPDHGLADNALYWLGESHYSEKSFQKALSAFLDITERYPDENKAPDALLKAGYSYVELNDSDKAEEAFSTLLKRYPKSQAAVKAMIGIATIISGKQK